MTKALLPWLSVLLKQLSDISIRNQNHQSNEYEKANGMNENDAFPLRRNWLASCPLIQREYSAASIQCREWHQIDQAKIEAQEG